jgi:Na+:H+ antiporter, NhaA family
MLTRIAKRVPAGIRIPIQEFIQGEQVSGVLLLSVTVAALLLANFGWGEALEHLWETPISLRFSGTHLDETLHFWINDALMAFFFLYVGLEIKREMVAGELSSLRKAALPLFAALGGMAFPALIYVVLNVGEGGQPRGWAVPTATDIAFSLGILALLGKRVPDGLKVFLAALAIADDLGAILIIGFAYSSDLDWQYLLLAGGVTAMLVVFNLLNVRRIAFYLVPGVVLWFALWKTGVHPTIAGVITAFCIPNSFLYSRAELAELASSKVDALGKHLKANTVSLREFTEEIEHLFVRVASPAQKLEFSLKWVVPFIIMPLFAFANTGLILSVDSLPGLLSPPDLGIMLGLIVGKPLGIYFFSRLIVRLGWGELPLGVDWRQILGAGMLAGIGFTMSIFVAGLAYTGSHQVEGAVLSVLIGSTVSGIIGYIYLSRLANRTVANT